jgi:pyruvate/2-oxoglutarate dehydrogenase complex dihydrolipoamide acyltransferase (E2) component
MPQIGASVEEARTHALARRARRGHSPVVLRVAAAHGVDLGQVAGTGRDGRVTKRDVLAVVESQSAAGDVAGSRWTESLRTAAHCHTFIEADMSRVELAGRALGVGPLPVVARAVIEALREHPVLNSRFGESGQELAVGDGVHLGVAVSLSFDGLIVPVVRDAHELSVEGLAERITDLTSRAERRALVPSELEGGTFTVTNLGAFGALMSTAIIHQPQVAILDMPAVVKRVVVVDDAIAIRPTAVFGLGWDHRALDGMLAAQFLATLRDTLESWPTLAA